MPPFYASVTIFVILVLSIGMHEAAHAKVGSYFGDMTCELAGLNTWNPITHIIRNFLTCVFIPAVAWFGFGFFFGGAAVPMDPAFRARNRFAAFCISAAGPAMTLLIAVVLGLCAIGAAYLHNIHPDPQLGMLGTTDPLLMVFLYSSGLNFMLVLLNLIPVPPLDGSNMLAAVFPALRPVFDSFGWMGLIILMVILNVPQFAGYFFLPWQLYNAGLITVINLVVPVGG